MGLEILYLVLSNIVFGVSRVLNVFFTVERKVFLTVVTGVLIKITWLISSAIGVMSIVNGNWLLAAIYVASGVLGDLIAFRIDKKYNKKKKDECI